MSYGEGNLHERVEELERENAELRSLARDMRDDIYQTMCVMFADFGAPKGTAYDERMAALGHPPCMKKTVATVRCDAGRKTRSSPPRGNSLWGSAPRPLAIGER